MSNSVRQEPSFAAVISCWEPDCDALLEVVKEQGIEDMIPFAVQAHYRQCHPERRAIERIPEVLERWTSDEMVD